MQLTKTTFSYNRASFEHNIVAKAMLCSKRSRNNLIVGSGVTSEEVQKMIVPTIVVVQSEDGGETSSVQITTTTTTTTTSLSAGCTPSCVKSSQMVRQASEINKSLLSPSGGGETHCNYNNVDSTSQLDQEEDVDLAQPIASLASIISS